ncbi:MAG: hypothetical protein DWQ01_04250 [Planctomycetota bacterium]|nr:MAG: hypothetical protein DWQ01_04250 [Planctomycetota bacterium]
MNPRRFTPTILVALGLVLPGCFGGGGSLSQSEAKTAGRFELLSLNLTEGAVWELNRSIRMVFNHPVDPNSVSFGSVLIRPVDSRIIGRPVTGSFQFEVGSGNTVLLFRPACPTNEENDNGGLAPGGYQYEISLPTTETFGATVLRDTSGHALAEGTTVQFRTPIPPSEILFLDSSNQPPAISDVIYPDGLNLFTDGEGAIEIFFDQAIDGRALNLNNSNVFLLYSGDTATNIGPNPQPSDFPDTNLVPGTLVLAENCTETGAKVLFQVAGILPPDRYLRLVMRSQFTDIVGQRNLVDSIWSDHRTPTLAELYQDPSWQESDPTVDEFRDEFLNATYVDADAGLSLPPAEIKDGRAFASFDFPGQFVPPEADFYLDLPYTEIFTDGQTLFSDSNGRVFVVNNGVLYVDEFHLAEGSTLRGRGRNPLVIYATGDVTLDGELDVSGNHSHWPTSLNSPQFPEGGSLGECGGGDGGTSSWITDRETPRGQTGYGAFQLEAAGGQGGEGCYQQANNGGSGDLECIRMVAGGGGGGNFALVANDSVVWTKWDKTTPEVPDGLDDEGPDHDATEHPFNPASGILGAEAGLRGSSFESNFFLENGETYSDPHGAYGMEDMTVDTVAWDGDRNLGGDFPRIDPPCDAPGCPDWDEGHPTNGPDGGAAGPSIFSGDGLTANDFWGSRFNPATGEFLVGELLAPWAGAGGGAGGDSQIITRQDIDGFAGIDPINDFYPDRPFQTYTQYYRKGAPGAGGGGQLLIMAIGTISIGPNAMIRANGGVGYGGESVSFTYWQISGSGGGSGGHVVLHSATALDLSRVTVDGVTNFAELVNTIQDQTTHLDLIRGIGGRRGWCASRLSRASDGIKLDGNGDFMIGRGGAGASGVLQIHVPNPATDLLFSTTNDFDQLVDQYVDSGGVMDADRMEEVLSIFASPKPYLLVPFFASGSQLQSRWIDSGLAYQRLDPDNGNDNYPDYANAALVQFLGVDGTGLVETTNFQVDRQTAVAAGSTAVADWQSNQMTLAGASSYFAPAFLRRPELLNGYDLLPDDSPNETGFQIVDAVYNRGTDVLTLTTAASDGPLISALNGNHPQWSVAAKFFRLDTSGLKDYLPSSTEVTFEFQGADESAPGSNEPGTPVPGPSQWTSDLSQLLGKRFIRYRVGFEINADEGGLSLNSPRPTLDYMKLPFVW